MDALDAGMPLETLLLDVVAAVQARVGHEWAANRLSVAQEHTATAVNERVLATLAHRASEQGDQTLGRIMVACIDGEWHAFPARLLAEVLRARGWQVDYLGAQVPTPHLVAHLHLTNPDAVALSSSLAIRLPAAHAAISACQAAGTPVVAGAPPSAPTAATPACSAPTPGPLTPVPPPTSWPPGCRTGSPPATSRPHWPTGSTPSSPGPRGTWCVTSWPTSPGACRSSRVTTSSSADGRRRTSPTWSTSCAPPCTSTTPSSSPPSWAG
ncbi:B12-binding domain-containing protein [Nonomuraea thailandensis]